jgi:hypothetical protein
VEGRKDTVLIPFASKFVVERKFDAGKIVIDLPEGFLEEAPDQHNSVIPAKAGTHGATGEKPSEAFPSGEMGPGFRRDDE